MKKVNTLNAESPTGKASVAWSPDGQWLAANHPDDSIALYHITGYPHALEPEPRFTLETGSVTRLQWVADRSLALTDDKNHISIWDIRISRKVRDIPQPASDLRAWNADFTVMVEAEGNHLRLGKVVEASLPVIQHVQLSADGSTAVIIASNHPTLPPNPERVIAEEKWPISAVEVWDVAHSERRFLNERFGLRSATWLNISPNGKYYILRGLYQGSDGVGDVRRECCVYESDTGKQLYRDWGVFDDVLMLPAWDQNSQHFMYWSWIKSLANPHKEATLGVVDGRTGKAFPLPVPKLTATLPSSLAWHPAKDLVALSDESGSIQVYNLQPEISLILTENR